MSTRVSQLAGSRPTRASLVDVRALCSAYYDLVPDSGVDAQKVQFGTSGHRGCAFDRSFNQWHVWAIVQAICDFRKIQDINGPLFLGIDTHALSMPAYRSALEVLAANSVRVIIAKDDEYTPTPVISHAILHYNLHRTEALSDGIVITPSHNPPDAGGIKYNGSNGGPADTATTRWIQVRANALLNRSLTEVKRMSFADAKRADSTLDFDFLTAYVADLASVVDMAAIARSGLKISIDPMGGAGIHYWHRIAERYAIDLQVLNNQLDPQFGFMTLDWDGKIRMDPSSAFAMQRLITAQHQFDIGVACDTDHDRHGVVCPGFGLLSANHYLSVAADYLFKHRPLWNARSGIGKTIVTTAMLDKIAVRLGRTIFEAPVGFKYFANGLLAGDIAFACEESAGASFSRMDGSAWTTDKDGISAALLAAEITAVTGQNPGQRYHAIEQELGLIYSDRVEAAASPAQKSALATLTVQQLARSTLAGDTVINALDHAPGNGAAIGGIKIISRSGWFSARPSGTENIYKIYAESYQSQAHLQLILADAQSIVDEALALPDELHA